MHPITVKEIVARCRRRQSEGAHTTVPPFSVKLLQDCVIQLSAALDRTASKAWLCEYSALNAVSAVGAPPGADSSEGRPKLVAPPEVDLDELEARCSRDWCRVPCSKDELRALIAELRELRGKAELAVEAAERVERLYHHPMGDDYMGNAIAGLMLALGFSDDDEIPAPPEETT